MEPITRQEQLLDSIATGNSVELEPITREEQYLSAIAGLTDFIPEKPITRKEMFYEKILESGGAGGDGTAKPTQSKTINVVENGTYKVTPDSGKVLSSVTAKVNVPERYDEGFAEGKDQGLSEGYSSGFGAGVNSVKLQEKTATENGDVLPDEGFSGMSKVTVDVPTSGGGKEEQEKTVTITENGTTDVTPDEGKTLSKVTIETNVAGSGEIGKPYIDTSKITNFKQFCANNRMNDQATELDTSNGTDLSNLFYGCDSLTKAIKLDTSKATTLAGAFYGCKNLTTISQLDTSKCEDFSLVFADCKKIQSIPPLDISNGRNFNYIFRDCSALATLEITTAKTDLNANAFSGCTGLENLTIGEGWAVNIYLTYSSNLTVESLHGMIENLADLTGQTAKTFSVGATNLAKIDEEHTAMLQAKNWNYS